MKSNKSAKDLAFDKERYKYRHEIKDLQREIKENLREIEILNQKISELEEISVKKTNGSVDFWNIQNFQRKI